MCKRRAALSAGTAVIRKTNGAVQQAQAAAADDAYHLPRLFFGIGFGIGAEVFFRGNACALTFKPERAGRYCFDFQTLRVNTDGSASADAGGRPASARVREARGRGRARGRGGRGRAAADASSGATDAGGAHDAFAVDIVPGMPDLAHSVCQVDGAALAWTTTDTRGSTINARTIGKHPSTARSTATPPSNKSLRVGFHRVVRLFIERTPAC